MSSLLTPSPEEDSFIILGSSPGTSLDIQCNGVKDSSINRIQLDDALKDVGPKASMAYKAHFKLGDGPSPGSLMAASTIVTDDKTTEQLQKSFGDILDENVILKDTLKQNNESMKQQFLLIASCQEDMMKTHMMHKEKFDETKEMIERLRQENQKLRLDLTRLVESNQTGVTQPSSHTSETQHSLTSSQTSKSAQQESLTSSQTSKSGPSSALEFVTSPDDDTINKLTDQLALVERQRREVIVENEKLIWQKENLERILDANSKERDELKGKINSLELHHSNIETEYIQRIELLNWTIQDLNVKQHEASNRAVSPEDIKLRDEVIQQLETKVSALQSDLKTAQLKVFELENVKLEFSKHKCEVSETARMYKDHIQELHHKLKEAQTTVFQPQRCSISPEVDKNSEFGTLMNNVKLYDTTLRHLAELLNQITHGSSDNIVQALGICASLHDFKLERATVNEVKAGLGELKAQLNKQHADALRNVTQVKGSLSIFEGIFKDYNELLKKTLTKSDKQPQSQSTNVETLANALLARGHELLAAKDELAALKADKEDKQLLQTQLELYKSDFEAERDARQKMASEKESIQTDLRKAQRQIQELLMQLEEVRKLNPNIHKSATSKRLSQSQAGSSPTAGAKPTTGTDTGNMAKKKKVSPQAKADTHETTPPLRFDCPVCDRAFKTLRLLEQHVDTCLL